MSGGFNNKALIATLWQRTSDKGSQYLSDFRGAGSPNMTAAAVGYATRMGWPSFPVHTVGGGGRCSCRKPECKNPGKHPRVYHGLKEATKEVEQIQAWWRRWPDMNIGVATGEVSGFFAVDVDPGHGGDDALRDLEKQHGELPATVRQITGSGGEHILFRHAPGLRNSASRIGAGLDIRGDGGYIIVPPSVHVSGRRYVWEVDHHPLDVPIAEAPTWLIAQAQGTDPDINGTATTTPSDRWIQAISTTCSEGRRNDTLARLAGHLLRRYVDPYVVLELARLWNHGRCHPPLEDVEVLRTVNSICLREAKRREAGHG